MPAAQCGEPARPPDANAYMYSCQFIYVQLLNHLSAGGHVPAAQRGEAARPVGAADWILYSYITLHS